MRMKIKESLESQDLLIFLDEAIFSPQTYLKKSWAAKFDHPYIQDKRSTMTTYALILAISIKYGIMHYKILKKSMKNEDFSKFLMELKQKYQFEKISLFMDNLSVHRSKNSKKIMEDLGINPIFSVPYSPQYNGIENTFSVLKNNYKKEMTKRIIKNHPLQIKQCIEQSLLMIRKNVIENQILNGLKNILNC